MTIVDWQYLAKYLPTFHFFVRGLVFIYLIWFNYNNVLWLIRGTSPLQSGSASGDSGVISGHLTDGGGKK